ncbi:hypothetical protein FLAT13_04847 [Flavobacterium salmonis]|uniref:Uncharacterized protein n=1 Tax=Flavobacterium salmonis TaxID=2654844 RepID=A0A6V6ZCN6_9FLAO|nr:hypothetical protein FLAT13_04847 [Flavobacterium salmonis]
MLTSFKNTFFDLNRSSYFFNELLLIFFQSSSLNFIFIFLDYERIDSIDNRLATKQVLIFI